MPVGFNSPARNLFLLGSTGAQVVTNFFQRIDQSAGTDGVYLPDEIKYNVPDQKFLLAGSNQTSASTGKGWFEKRTAAGSRDWLVEVTSTQSNINTTLRALEIDSLNNLIVCGKTGTVPWIAKYTNGGEISWQVTSNTANVEYTGIAVDSSNNIYACGSSSTQAFIEKVDGTGSYSWGKYSSTTAGAITFFKCDANNRGEVVAVGKIEDTIKDKGYIAKVNTATGDLLWDRTIEDPRLATSSSYWQTECTDVYIDSKEQIYVVGTIRDTIGNLSKGFLIKYSPEGNIVWQKETKLDRNFEFYAVKSDGETQQTIALGRFTHSNDDFLFLNKYSQDGTLLWTRTLYSSLDQTVSNVSLDADASFYYLLFTDETTNLVSGEADTYTFGKVSTSGNGFGAFQYSSGGINYNYAILNITDNIGRLTDGSVRNDASDFITYPFEANKILFDDLATQITNKKVQVDEAGTYSDPTYSITTGYPNISKDAIVYDSSLLLNYDFKNKSCFNLNHNIVSYSENLNSWVFGGTSTVSSNIIASPIGTITADLLDLSLSPTNNMLYQGVTLVTGKTYTLSLWIKSVDGTTGTWGVNFYDGGHNRTTVPITGEWVRVSYTFTPTQQSVNIYPGDNRSSLANKNQAYIWGIQLEQASIPGTYVYTNASPVLYPTSTNNLSSTSYAGTITEATFNSAGYFVFDGTNDYIEHATGSFPITGDVAISLEGWFYFTGTNGAGDYKTFFAYGNGPSAGDTIAVGLFDNFRLSASFNGGLNAQTAQNVFPTNVWKHVLLTKSPGAINTTTKIYMNGVEQTITSAPTNSPNFSSRVIRLGRWTNESAGYYYQGRMGEVRIYNKALSAAEVSQNFNATRAKYGV